jgi:hypothetical protein
VNANPLTGSVLIEHSAGASELATMELPIARPPKRLPARNTGTPMMWTAHTQL